jgi:hypothetical protein
MSYLILLQLEPLPVITALVEGNQVQILKIPYLNFEVYSTGESELNIIYCLFFQITCGGGSFLLSILGESGTILRI